MLYVPCLRWKPAEVSAIEKLKKTTHANIVPLLTITSTKDEKRERVSDTNHQTMIETGIKGISGRAGYLSWCDLNEISLSTKPFGFHPVRAFFDLARKKSCKLAPVVRLSSDGTFRTEAKRAIERDGVGIVLRLFINEIDASKKYQSEIGTLLANLSVTSADVDLVIDLRMLPDMDADIYVQLVEIQLQSVMSYGQWKSVTLTGSSIPMTLTNFRKGMHRKLRDEWVLWRKIALQSFPQKILFGDYTIKSLVIMDEFDPKQIGPASPSIRYTYDDQWIIFRGKASKADRTNEARLPYYKEHCKILCRMREFSGSSFSYGDEEIEKLANGVGKSASPQAWLKNGINHHIEVVVDQLSKMSGISKSASPSPVIGPAVQSQQA